MNLFKNIIFFVIIPCLCFSEVYLSSPKKIVSFECCFIRKNFYNNFSKTVKGRLYFDDVKKSIAYEYGAPFNFKFIINDTIILGINLKKNIGYILNINKILSSYCNVYNSINFIEPYLKCVNADNSYKILRRNFDANYIFELKNNLGYQLYIQDIDLATITCIESFDFKDDLIEKIKFRYNAKKNFYDFPIWMERKRMCNNIFMVDTILFYDISLNKKVTNEYFLPPKGCKLNNIEDMEKIYIIDK